MNKVTKGALTMVLVGATTFSAANALLANHSITQLVKGHVSTNSGHPIIADHNNQTDKTGKNQTPIMHVNDSQPMLSSHFTAPQAVLENENKSDQDTAMIQRNQATTSAASTTAMAPASAANTATATNTATAIFTASATSIAPVTKVAPATNTTANSNITAAATTSSKSSSTAVTVTSTTTTNHGKQISQAAKDKAAIR